MANSLLTIGMVTRKALQLFRNANSFLKMIDKQYDPQFSRDGYKIGSSLRIRLPNDYVVRSGPTAVVQNTSENYVTLNVATQVGVDVNFSSVERSLSLDDFADRVLAPMINNLAGAVAIDIMSGAETIPNLVHNVDGSNNTVSPTASTWLTAGAVLDRGSTPRGERSVIVDPLSMARTVGTLAGLFNPQDKIGNQFSKAMIYNNVLGFDWAMDQNVRLHTTGTFTAGTVNGAGQSGSTITVNSTTGTLAVGDIVTFAGVFGVNRTNKQTNTGTLAQFAVTAAAGAGSTSLSIYPALVPPAAGNNVAYQTVSASPANSAAIAPVSNASETYRKNFAFDPSAATMATADLALPTGAVIACDRQQYDGISIRCVDDFITLTDQWITRTDIVYGYVWPRPEFAVVIADVT